MTTNNAEAVSKTEPAPAPRSKEYFHRTENQYAIDVSTPHINIIGVSSNSELRPTQPNYDSLHVKEHEGGSVVVALVDGVGIEGEEQEEVDYCHGVTEKLADTTRLADACKYSADEKLRSLSSEPTNSELAVNRPMLWMKITPDKEKGKAIVEWLAQGDITIFVERDLLPETQIAYLDKTTDGRSFSGDMGVFLLDQRESMFVATDGGVEALTMPEVIKHFPKDRFRSWERPPERGELMERRGNVMRVFDKVSHHMTLPESIDALREGMREFRKAILNSNFFKGMRSTGNAILKMKGGLLDDATIFGISYNKNAWNSYPAHLRPLHDELMTETEYLDDTIHERIIRQYGVEVAAQLVDEIIRRDTRVAPRLFSRALSLVRPEELNQQSQEYLEKNGLVRVPGVLNVFPAFFKEQDAFICNDLGLASFGAEAYSSVRANTWQTLCDCFHPHKRETQDPTERFPRGVWMDFRHTLGQHFTVTGAFMVGEEGRGILAPAYLGGGIYLHSPNEMLKEDRKAFFSMTSRVWDLTATAMIAYSYLLGHPEMETKVEFKPKTVHKFS